MGYEEFSITSGYDGRQYGCRFYTLMTAISLRHSDTVDVQFLVNGKPVVVALPHAALAEHRRRTGQVLTDAETIQIAGLFLKETLEKEGLPQGEGGAEVPTIVPSIEQTLVLAGNIH